MLDSFWQRLDLGGRLALPLVTTVFCALLGSIVWPLPHFGAVAPPLALMAIYYWALHRPDLLRPGMVFGVGLLHDILNDLPLGLSALLFVAAHQILFRERRYFVGHSFLMMWFGFILTAVGVMALEWFALGIIHWQVIPVLPVAMQVLLAIALFPLPCRGLMFLQRLTLSI